MTLTTVKDVRQAHDDLRHFFNDWMAHRTMGDAPPEYGPCECRICKEAVA